MNSINQYSLKIISNPYFTNLKNMSLEQFAFGQESFIHAVDNWSKMLGLMIFKVPTNKERWILIKNLNDEHGNGNLNESHVNTFILLLESINGNINKPISKEVLIFNNTIQNYIETNIWIKAIAFLAIIEFVYVDICKQIHDYLCLFIPKENIKHYSLHEILDVEHYKELISLIEPYTHTHYDEIQNGYKDGFNCIYELYEQMYSKKFQH